MRQRLFLRTGAKGKGRLKRVLHGQYVGEIQYLNTENKEVDLDSICNAEQKTGKLAFMF
jgi:hypothetical protein